MSGRSPYLRSLAGGAGASGLLVVLGGRGNTAMDYARQAGAGGVACAVGDWYKATYGDASMMGSVMSSAITGLTFAGINKFALGSQDSWVVLTVGGVVIDVVAGFIENPLGNALGL
jgi:hypothetical protein